MRRDTKVATGRGAKARRRVVWALTLAALVCVAAAAKAHLWPPPAAARAEASAMAVGRSRGGIEDLLLTIRDTGIEPAEVTRPPGKFLLSVDNKSGAEQLTLRLDREGGGHIREIEVPKAAADWAEELDLPAGRYVLTEVHHPHWSCRLVLE